VAVALKGKASRLARETRQGAGRRPGRISDDRVESAADARGAVGLEEQLREFDLPVEEPLMFRDGPRGTPPSIQDRSRQR